MHDNIISAIKQQGVLPLFFNANAATCTGLVKALYTAGIRSFEFTNRGEAALENFKQLVAERDRSMPGLLLGIGTIRTPQQAKDFADAGADFLISPMFDKLIADEAKALNLLWIPGCMTPSEIHAAELSGCKMVKLFPGNVLGPGFVSAIKELFPKILFMPTGGVEPTVENMSAWFNSGVIAVGMGSKLITKKMMDENGFEELELKAKELLELVTESRG